MANMLTIQQIMTGMKLEILAGKNGVNRIVDNPNLSKPGVELAGMFDFYEHDRIQIIGSKEMTYFHWLKENDQKARVRELFAKEPPAFVFSTNVAVPKLFL
ncbi:MAG TPA: HPr kinase/phosphorylase, partial [Bacillota bacterium]|nr:HPr kinase/phosphorylase [Bacillota bacterium]